MSRALYRKYRSKTLDEVIGQRHITDVLARAIASGHVSHAYLLTGPRGVGKTSVARILAHEINGLKYDEENLHLDIIEIDAASNNGVEDVRDLREKVQIAPTSAKKKVYIIDEVHMLSKAAFNALLKTLEEPPEHVIFILATTNVEKLPATIISRTQRFSFRPISIRDVVAHLKNIAKEEKIKIDDEALQLIAKRGEGSFRDSISLLDQISDLTGSENKVITADLVEEMLGLAPHKVIDKIIEAVENRDVNEVVAILNRASTEGASAALIAKQLTTIISESVADKPQLLPLLDGLIEVEKSSNPELKLLSVLGMFASSKPPTKSVALASPTRGVSASIKKLKKMTDNIHTEGEDIAFDDPLEPKSEMAPGPISDLVRNRVEESDIRAVENNDHSKAASSDVPEPLSDVARSCVDQYDIGALDWDKFINHAKQNYIAIHSVLAVCGYQLDGDVLNLYTRNKFYKKKLDELKHASLISKCLSEIGVFGLTVHTIPTTLPPKDAMQLR